MRKPSMCWSIAQDHRFGGTWLERCSNVDLHGPYEQTWTAGELDFTQGTILTMDNTSTPHIATVQVCWPHSCTNNAEPVCMRPALCAVSPACHL